MINWTDKLWAYNHGLLSSNGIVFLFSYLVSSGRIFDLPKTHRDTAESFISFGLMDTAGKIDWDTYYKLFSSKE